MVNPIDELRHGATEGKENPRRERRGYRVRPFRDAYPMAARRRLAGDTVTVAIIAAIAGHRVGDTGENEWYTPLSWKWPGDRGVCNACNALHSI